MTKYKPCVKILFCFGNKSIYVLFALCRASAGSVYVADFLKFVVKAQIWSIKIWVDLSLVADSVSSRFECSCSYSSNLTMAFTLTELDIIIAKISRHLPSDECSGVYLRKRENSQVAKDAASAGVNELWASNSNSSDMFNTPGTSDYTPRGAAAASPPMNQSSSSGGNCGQVSSSDLNQVPRHGSISSSAGRRSTDCENCIHLQNQMLRFKEQVVVIRGNLGNR